MSIFKRIVSSDLHAPTKTVFTYFFSILIVGSFALLVAFWSNAQEKGMIKPIVVAALVLGIVLGVLLDRKIKRFLPLVAFGAVALAIVCICQLWWNP